MSKANTFESDLLSAIFCAKPIANISDNAASSPLTSLWASLHTADPGEVDTQNTSESAYTGYTRTSVARTTAGFVVSSGSVSPVSAISFPQAMSTSTSTITHFGIGTSSAGTGKMLYSGTVSPNISIGQNVTPRLSTGSSIQED